MFNRLFANMPPVVKNLLIINLIIWGAMELVPSINAVLTRWCALRYFSSPGFNAAQLITYMFLHANFTHLLFNMFGLVMFGGVIERSMDSKRFLFYYLSCGIFAALVQMAVYAIVLSKYMPYYSHEQFRAMVEIGWDVMNGRHVPEYLLSDPSIVNIFTNPDYISVNRIVNNLVNGPMVGASGAIYAVILAFGMLFPNQPLYLFFLPIPIKAKYMVIGYGVIELLLGIGSFSDNIAHFAHLGGMISGVLLILYWKKKGVFNNHWFF